MLYLSLRALVRHQHARAARTRRVSQKSPRTREKKPVSAAKETYTAYLLAHVESLPPPAPASASLRRSTALCPLWPAGRRRGVAATKSRRPGFKCSCGGTCEGACAAEQRNKNTMQPGWPGPFLPSLMRTEKHSHFGAGPPHRPRPFRK
jgi:hypothetical protein